MFYEMVRWEGVCYLLLDSPGCCWMDGGWPWMLLDAAEWSSMVLNGP